MDPVNLSSPTRYEKIVDTCVSYSSIQKTKIAIHALQALTALASSHFLGSKITAILFGRVSSRFSFSIKILVLSITVVFVKIIGRPFFRVLGQLKDKETRKTRSEQVDRLTEVIHGTSFKDNLLSTMLKKVNAGEITPEDVSSNPITVVKRSLHYPNGPFWVVFCLEDKNRSDCRPFIVSVGIAMGGYMVRDKSDRGDFKNLAFEDLMEKLTSIIDNKSSEYELVRRRTEDSSLGEKSS